MERSIKAQPPFAKLISDTNTSPTRRRGNASRFYSSALVLTSPSSEPFRQRLHRPLLIERRRSEAS